MPNRNCESGSDILAVKAMFFLLMSSLFMILVEIVMFLDSDFFIFQRPFFFLPSRVLLFDMDVAGVSQPITIYRLW